MLGTNILQTAKTAIYTRVSTFDQVRAGYSLDSQEEVCQAFISRNPNLQYVETFSDPGISGKSIQHRPGLKRLIEKVKSGEINAIVVWKNSRLTRSLKDLLELMNLFFELDTQIFSVSEGPLIDNASGRLQISLMTALNQYERENISENVFAGLIKRTSMGLHNSKAPLGYDNTTDTMGNKILAINPEEAPIVTRIFTEYTMKHKGYQAIAHQLNKDGIKTKPGNDFSVTAVKNILLNPLYNGKVQWAKYKDWEKYRRSKGASSDYMLVDGLHEAIIDDELWEATMIELHARSKQPSWNGRNENLLTGIIRCPQCGGPMTVTNTTNTLRDGTKKRTRYYSCATAQSKGSSVCSANSIQADMAESLVQRRMLELLAITHFGKDVLAQLENAKDKQAKEIATKINKIDTDLALVSGHIDTYKALAQDPVNIGLKGTFLQQMHTQEIELQRLENDRKVLLQTQTGYQHIPAIEDITTILKLVSETTRSNRTNNNLLRVLYKSIISSVTFNKNEKLFMVNLRFNNDILTELTEYTEKGSNLELLPFLHGSISFHV